MHKQNVRMIIFRGQEGKKAINQILTAKPVKNKFSMTVKERSEEFALNFTKMFNPSFQQKQNNE